MQALRHDETPDYAALEEDIKKMLFDEAKFNMMLEEALNVFYGRLIAEVWQEGKAEGSLRAATKFINQEEQVKIFSKIEGQVHAKFCKRPFNKWSTFTISAIK